MLYRIITSTVLVIILIGCGKQEKRKPGITIDGIKVVPKSIKVVKKQKDPFDLLEWEFVKIPKDIPQAKEDRSPVNLIKNWRFVIENPEKYGIDVRKMSQTRASVLFTCGTEDVEFFEKWFVTNYLFNSKKVDHSQLSSHLGNIWKIKIQKMK